LSLLIICVPIKLSIRLKVSQYRCLGGVTCLWMVSNKLSQCAIYAEGIKSNSHLVLCDHHIPLTQSLTAATKWKNKLIMKKKLRQRWSTIPPMKKNTTSQLKSMITKMAMTYRDGLWQIHIQNYKYGNYFDKPAHRKVAYHPNKCVMFVLRNKKKTFEVKKKSISVIIKSQNSLNVLIVSSWNALPDWRQEYYIMTFR
jgi:hypothetical protein